MATVFLSYANEDRFAARELAERLRSNGYDCFVDFEGVDRTVRRNG